MRENGDSNILWVNVLYEKKNSFLQTRTALRLKGLRLQLFFKGLFYYFAKGEGIEVLGGYGGVEGVFFPFVEDSHDGLFFFVAV